MTTFKIVKNSKLANVHKVIHHMVHTFYKKNQNV
jgi:hypothetical protein